jgi:hypothetical protein
VKKSEKISFLLLELEMTDLERFLRKTPLGPLGVKLLRVQRQQFTLFTLQNPFC